MSGDTYVGTYSEVKRAEHGEAVHALPEGDMAGRKGYRKDRSAEGEHGDKGWPVITQTGSLGMWDHPIMREVAIAGEGVSRSHRSSRHAE